MSNTIYKIISERLGITLSQTNNTIELLDEGCTVPFIARYRKEKTGSLDEVYISNIKDLYEKLQELEKRKLSILGTIEEQGNLTPELRQRIEICYDATELEDIYLPYKPKRRTRATIARENGLEPLAKIIMAQYEKNLENKAVSFQNDKVASVEEALAGARDIIAEWVSENERARNIVRNNFRKYAVIRSKVTKEKEAEGDKYKDYFDWNEPLKKCPSHRLLAMRRGENEGFLRVSIIPDEEQALNQLIPHFVKGYGSCSDQVKKAVEDSFKRLLQPSIETEFANLSKSRPIGKLYRFLQITYGNFCLPHHWDNTARSHWILVTVPAAR
jgi:protein Tex